jgi:hypothetical protein
MVINCLTRFWHAGHRPLPLLVRKAAAFVTRILRVFGLSSAGPDELGFGGASGAHQSDNAPLLDALAAFRDTVRGEAKRSGQSEILKACDRCGPSCRSPLNSVRRQGIMEQRGLLQSRVYTCVSRTVVLT